MHRLFPALAAAAMCARPGTPSDDAFEAEPKKADVLKRTFDRRPPLAPQAALAR